MPETNFFWDPVSDNILQERDEIGAVTAEYTTEPGQYGSLISQNRQGVESQYHFDALGSTLALTDDNQQVTDTNGYTAFGELTEQTGSTVNPFQYIGQKGYYRDEVTGQHLVRRRSLSPDGRWTSRDPLGFQSGINLYEYCGDSPLMRTDPSGLIGSMAPPRPTPMPGVPARPHPGSAECSCRNWAANEAKTLGWLATLPNCPCSIGSPPANPNANVWYPPEAASQYFHPGATSCIRSIPTTSGGPGQQCCYDKSGALITGGNAAGTPDKIAPSNWWIAIWHGNTDVVPFNWCKNAGLVNIYVVGRPPNKGIKCKANVI